MYTLNDAVFSYILSTDSHSAFSEHLEFADGLSFSFTPKTNVLIRSDDKKAVAVVGLCIDSHGELSPEEVPAYLLNAGCSSVEEHFKLCARFAGKYIICLHFNGGVYLWGDATCSLPAFYSKSGFGKECVSCYEQMVAEKCGEKVSDYSAAIRAAGEETQPMPFNLTMYENVKALLPNHYLDVKTGNAFRVLLNAPEKKNASETEIDGIIRTSSKLIENIAKGYSGKYSFVCPLTSGYDSRINLAFLLRCGDPVPCYTFFHKGFSETTGDIVIPRKICADLGLSHQVIPDQDMPEELKKSIKSFIGDSITEKSLRLANTFNSEFAGKALLSGDIVAHIGKSVIGNNVPECLATGGYLTAKIHNVSRDAKKEVKNHIREIRKAGEKSCIFDMFALESRCGRWGAKISSEYAACGVSMLNLYNCSELISLWMTIPRKFRVKKIVHTGLLKTIKPELLSYPFNPDSKYSLLKLNWVTYYFATRGKHFLLKCRRPQ